MDVIVSNHGDKTSNFLADTIQHLSEGLTGIAASGKKDWALSVGYILQRLRNGRFLEALKHEWDSYRKRGRIKDDYIASDQHQECLQEMLDFLDKDSPDRIRFEAMKHLFLNTASECISDRDSILPQQYMRICRSLNSTEVLILHTNYNLVKSGNAPTEYGASTWLNDIANNSVLKHASLVESREMSLIQQCLITDRTHVDRSGVIRSNYYRLTELGYAICQFMQFMNPEELQEQ